MITPSHLTLRFPSLTFRLSPRLAACALLVCGIAPSPAEVSGPVPPVNFSPSEDYAKREINYQGVPSIARSPSGRLWAVWYAGPKGEDIYNYLLAATSTDDGKTWSEIKFLIDPDGDGPLRACNPVFWTDPDGTLWLFWCQFPESKTTQSLVYAMSTSNPDDVNPTWTKPRSIFQGVTQNKPIVNHQGDWLLPVAIWYQPDSIRVAVSSDRGETWSLRGTANVPEAKDRNCDEPMIVEVGTDLLMLVRTKYGIGRSTSTDCGRTWEPVTPTTLPHTPTRLYLSKLNSGNLLLVKHGPLEGKPVGRKKLTAYLSKDGGTTWEGGLLLDERPGVSYPDGTQADDGTIYLIYDRDRYGEREVLFSTFTEEDILAKKPVSDKFRTKQLINKAPGVAKGKPQANNREQPAPTKPLGVCGALQSGANQKTPALQGTGLLEVGS